MASSSFSELLQKRRESYEAEATKNREIVNEWVQAIEKLFAELRAWLAISDPDQILQVEQIKTEVNEPGVGRYQAPRLDIRAFGKWVGIIPKARKTVGMARPPQQGAPAHATGRVDITDELRRYILYRFESCDGDSWLIEGPASDSAQKLTRELFEEALMSYFQ